ncbi:hypothetical protein DFH07DRAFT_747615, partial [Mycena maculata]
YKKCRKSSVDASVCTYTYYCAQNEKKVQRPHLNDDPSKQRARLKMDRCPCGGSLQITMKDDDLSRLLRLKLAHHQPHIPYVDIAIPKPVKDLVQQSK